MSDETMRRARAENETQLSEEQVSQQATRPDDPQAKRLEALTLEYIAQWEADEAPDLTVYTQRAPELSTELQANLVHYMLEGRDEIERVEEERTTPGYAAQVAAQAADPVHRARKKRLLDAVFGQPAVPSTAPVISSLFAIASALGLAPRALAERLGISFDIIMALEQRLITLSGLPRRLVTQLAAALGTSTDDIVRYLQSPATASAFHLNPSRPQEARPQDFAAWVQQSTQLTLEQKTMWLHESATAPYTDPTSQDLDTDAL